MLEFGTAGIRGIMGDGDNQINTGVIRRTTMGLADFLKKKYAEPKVVISYDSRNGSEDFAREAAKVLAGNGIEALLWPEMMPVPVLSFSVRYMGCAAGIMITASHNPKEYNGYKVYGPNGGQILEEDADAIQKEILAVIEAEKFEAEKFEAEKRGTKAINAAQGDASCSRVILESDDYKTVDMAVYDEYKKAMEAQSDLACGDIENPGNLSIVYTPLNGSGRKPVTDMLKKNGFSFMMVSEQEMPDGNFTTCPSPNPEKAEVYEIAKRYGMRGGAAFGLDAAMDSARSSGESEPQAERALADILIATDPDCDRVGCMVWDGKEYVLLSGNEIGTLMAYFFCGRIADADAKHDGVGNAVSSAKRGTIVCSLVSTPIIERIAEAYGLKVVRTPVGFKYIGDKMDELGERFIFGFEESNGYLVGDYARDKDGVVGAKILCRMAAFYKEQSKSLIDVLDGIYEKFGRVINRTISVDLEPGQPKPEMTVTNFDDGSRLIVRPSGTEPKVKYYLSAGSEERIAELKIMAGI